MRKSAVLGIFLALTSSGCATYPRVNEIKMMGYSDDVSKGKPIGAVTASDCVWKILRYPLGEDPTISTALANLKTQKKSSTVEDIAGKGREGQAVRYVNNVSVKYDGFDAYLVGRSCVNVNAMGFI